MPTVSAQVARVLADHVGQVFGVMGTAMPTCWMPSSGCPR